MYGLPFSVFVRQVISISTAIQSSKLLGQLWSWNLGLSNLHLKCRHSTPWNGCQLMTRTNFSPNGTFSAVLVLNLTKPLKVQNVHLHVISMIYIILRIRSPECKLLKGVVLPQKKGTQLNLKRSDQECDAYKYHIYLMAREFNSS